MEKILLHDKTFRPFIPYSRLEQAIDGIAAKLNEDFKDATDPPQLLCVLNGAVMFTAELMKRLSFPLELISLKLSSYQGTKSSGKVLEVMGLTAPVEGKTVIICEDIVDTGGTIAALKHMLQEKGAKDVRICTMLLKPDVFKARTHLDYVGMEIPNAFIVGFGLDYNELGRNIPDIYVIDE